jgi:hypothetical protein
MEFVIRRLPSVAGLMVLAVFLGFCLRAPVARAARCPAGNDGYVSTIRTSCAEAKAVLGKALRKIPLPEFRIYLHGWWHCSYTEIGGHGTFTAERRYGTPQRQVVIVVVR